MAYTTLFIDLDDTLYSSECGLWEAIRSRMGKYMEEKLGVPEDQVFELRRHYFQTYGTTLRGLQKHHQVDAEEYLAFVHDLPLELFIQPDPELPKLLEALPQKRFIFTNADINHARRVLKILGVENCFDGIIDIWALDFACKPEDLAYQRALFLADNPNPSECLMMDDSMVNLEAACQMGFTTILVSKNNLDHPTIPFKVPNLHAIPLLYPALWRRLIAGADEGD